MNIALYRLDGGRGAWAMTERGRRALVRDATTIAIGPSALSWEGGVLTARIDEIAAPLPARLRGTVRLTPEIETTRAFPLDAHGRHHWRPVAPRAHAEIAFTAPALRWQGHGYFDTNVGVEPLETPFRRWDWARARSGHGALLYYDVDRLDGGADSLALRVHPDGRYEDIAPPERRTLPRTAWGVERYARADGDIRVQKTLEDTPFYARSALQTIVTGEPLALMHESLSLDRFRTPLVRAMLPFRMPRITF